MTDDTEPTSEPAAPTADADEIADTNETADVAETADAETADTDEITDADETADTDETADADETADTDETANVDAFEEIETADELTGEPGMDDRVAALLSAFGLKSETRTGWTDAGIADAESVAAHSWGVALLALTLVDEWETATGESLDRARVLELAIVHDLGEAIVGDVPATADDREQAERAERAAIEAFGGVLDAPLADRYREFAVGETSEARFVRELDKLEMLTQAVRYERDGPSLAAFFDTASDRIDSEPGRAWFDRLVAARETVASSDEESDAVESSNEESDAIESSDDDPPNRSI